MQNMKSFNRVVNMVKGCGNKFEGSIHTYAGDYQSGDNITTI